MIAGTWASSPSKKNPNTISPGSMYIDCAEFFAPVPAVGGHNTIAKGKSLSGNFFSSG